MEILKNFKLAIKGTEAEDFMEEFNVIIYYELEILLDTFNNNRDYHTDNYNQKFDGAIFGNVCNAIPELNDLEWECETYNQGILKKGMYSSIIK